MGAPRLELEGSGPKPVQSTGPGKSLALITYLALAPRRTVGRDFICDLLWGDRNLDRARPLLRQTLWLIKTQIHNELITATSDAVALSFPLTVDADEFADAIASNQLERAVSLYSGDFFGGYAAPGAARFEEWASLEGTRLRGIFVHAAEALARRALDSGRFPEAIALARRMRMADPHGQASWRLLLEARIASGDSIGARAEADQFEQWLHDEEWESEPASRATIQAARRSKESRDSAPNRDELVAELVGREKEFSAIHDAWLHAQSRGARIIHITAESGLGKTRLTRDIVARIRASRGKARYLKANYAERDIPFSFAATIAETLSSMRGAGGVAPAAAATLVSLNPKLSSTYSTLSGSSAPLEPLRVGLALLELVSSIADERPIALALDDTHWCDQSSRETLTVVASRLGLENVLLISAARPRYTARSLCAESLEIPLVRLSPGDVLALVTSLAQLPEEPWAGVLPERLCRSADGNPQRVLEALRACLDDALLSRRNEQWHCDDADALIAALGESAIIKRRISALTPDEYALLLLLSVAGIPLPRNIVIDAGQDWISDGCKAAANLEVRGLIGIEDDSWAPAHDTIAEGVVASAEPQAVIGSNARLGAAMAASDDLAWRKRAIPHLVEARQWGAAAEAIVPLVRGAVSTSAHVTERIMSLLGSSGGSDAALQIRRELPLSLRHPGLRKQALFTALLLAAGLGAVGFSDLRRDAESTGTRLVAFTRTSRGTMDVRISNLSLNVWDAALPLRFELRRGIPDWSNIRHSHATPRPGTETWAVYSFYPDSGDGEIDLADLKGNRIRLTHARGDDRPMSFSPDGSQLLFLTTRWSRNGWSDVAVLDIASGRVRRVSQMNDKHYSPSWSPDGTRIAFTRTPMHQTRSEICVADSDGSRIRCGQPAGWESVSQLGWLDGHRLLISGIVPNSRTTRGVYDIDRGSAARSSIAVEGHTILDPTGTWVFAESEAGRTGNPTVFPSTRPDLARVILEDSTEATLFAFMLPTLEGSFLDSVAILHPKEPLVPGVPHLLRPAGWSRDRRRSTPTVARWRSLTPSVAEVDSLGVLLARDTGFAIVELSAGGWRHAVDTLEIRSSPMVTVVDEKWNSGSFARWRAFGDPKPVLVRGRNANALLNNGDGNFFSGVYLRKPVDTQRGLAIDAEVSTPITRTQWQLIQVFVEALPSQDGIANWDHRTGYIDPFIGENQGCAFQYPEGEGTEAVTGPTWLASMRAAMADTSYRIDTGAWYRVRLQVFPDDRCGIAINGRAVVLHRSHGPGDVPVLPIIQGSSVGTRVLVGRVVIREGTPADIDWTALRFNGLQWLRQ